MSRPLRIEYAGVLYHVTSRRDGRKDIYLNDTDRQNFLSILGNMCSRFNWAIHAYCLMGNHYHLSEMMESPDWLDTEWCFSSFAKNRKTAIERYRQFVSKGKNQPPPWEQLRNQIFLGDEQFIKSTQSKLKPNQELSGIPSARRRKIPKPLDHYSSMYRVRNEAIIAAYRSGGYSMKAIGDHFGVHYSSVSKIIKAGENSRFKA